MYDVEQNRIFRSIFDWMQILKDVRYLRYSTIYQYPGKFNFRKTNIFMSEFFMWNSSEAHIRYIDVPLLAHLEVKKVTTYPVLKF